MNTRVANPAKRGAASMPSGIDSEAVAKIADTLTALSADLFALYIKTKNFHWHVRDRIFATTTCSSTSKASSCLRPPTEWLNASGSWAE